jgi:hypothetical protein
VHTLTLTDILSSPCTQTEHTSHTCISRDGFAGSPPPPLAGTSLSRAHPRLSARACGLAGCRRRSTPLPVRPSAWGAPRPPVSGLWSSVSIWPPAGAHCQSWDVKYSLRPIKHENLVFRDQISGGVKLRMYPSFILHRVQHSSYLRCSLKLSDTAGGRKSAWESHGHAWMDGSCGCKLFFYEWVLKKKLIFTFTFTLGSHLLWDNI